MWLHLVRARLENLRLRARFLFRRRVVEREMDEELRFHIEKEIEENLREGMSPAQARRRALVAFGGEERYREQIRDARGVRPLEDLMRDIRYAVRQLRRTPLFSTVAVVTLAVGIGANTGVFSVVNGLLLRDRPYRAPETLVHVYSSVEDESPYATSYARDLDDLRKLDDVFQGVGAFAGVASRITEGDGARMVRVECVTANLFPLLGLEMALGRGFTDTGDAALSASPLVVLGHGLWERRYGGDTDVVGKTLRIAGLPFTIIGVAPESLESFTAQGFHTDLFVPMGMAGAFAGERDPDREPSVRGPLGTKIIGRLRQGITLEHAQSRADALASDLRRVYPDLYEGRSFNLFPTREVALQPDLDAYLDAGAALLMTAVGLVLLLACTNLASFLLARGLDRRREIALRLALGAPRGRLVRQLLTETLTLGVLGAVAGVVLAQWTLHALRALAPAMALPLNIDTRMDGPVVLFAAGITALAGVLAGLAPALQTTNPDVAPTLKGVPGPRGGHRVSLRGALVGFQIGISMILLVAGGLFVRSFQAARDADLGFATREAALLWIDLDVSGVPRARWESVAGTLKERAIALPGVDKVATSNGVQLSESVWQAEYTIPGLDPPPGREFHRAYFLAVDPDYLDVMGIPVTEGRGLEPSDREGSEPVVVVSDGAARRFWPDQDPLGKEIRPAQGDQTFRVAGVARDTKVARLGERSEPLFYFPRAQYPRRSSQLWLVARGSKPAAETVGALRRLTRELDPDLVVVQAKTLEDQLALTLFLPRVGASLLGFLGLMALTLASVGLFGMVSYDVSRRTREVGIRMSLGASRATLVRAVVKDVMGVVLTGCLLGLLASLGLAYLAGAYLTGVRAFDAMTLGGAPLLLLVVSVFAALVPAWRASRVSPVRALAAD
jgi:predicted permease